MFSRLVECSVAIAMVAGLTVSGVAQTPATRQTAPAAVNAAFKKAYPNATMKLVTKEVENGKTVYEVESVDNGRRRDLVYNPDGNVIIIEDEMTEAEFPAAVAAAIAKRYPKATITLREKLTITKGSVVQYEAQLKGAGTVTEAILTVDGKWVSPKAVP